MEYTDYDTRVGAYGVITDDRHRVLLAHWNERPPATWTMPGGGVELYESTEEATIREIAEETGYEARLLGLLGVDARVVAAENRWLNTDRPLKFIQVIYRAEVIGGALRNELEGSTDEARWFSLDEVSALPRVSLVDRALVLAGLIPSDSEPS